MAMSPNPDNEEDSKSEMDPSPEWISYKGSPTGATIECEDWQQEAALRMLNNNLDPDVGEDPSNLIVYGGTGKAARNWEAYEAILDELRGLKSTETLLIQSGKPVGVFTTHERAPRVLIANTNLVSKWDTWEHFRNLEKRGLMMYGQYTAGSWGYIGTQGIIQGTYEVLSKCARDHFDGDIQGQIVATGGLGGMGGAQPLAVTMNGGVCIAAEVKSDRIARRQESGYLEDSTGDLDVAITRATEAANAGKPYSIAVKINAAEMLEGFLERDIIPDIVTDQTSAHDELNGYYPSGYTVEEADRIRETSPEKYVEESLSTMEQHVRAMLALQKQGAVTFAYGNNIRGQVADRRDLPEAFDIPGFTKEYIRPLFCEGKGPFRWIALSGNPSDIERTDIALKEMFPNKESLHRWIDLAQDQVPYQGLPARVCWLGCQTGDTGHTERAEAALAFNNLVANGEVEAPIVVTRDHLDAGSVASPTRATEDMADGSDAVADWPILNGLLTCAAGADIVSIHGGGGAFGNAQSANNHVVLDGSDLARAKALRVLNADPGSGVIRHADAGYERAKQQAEKSDIHIPIDHR